MTRTFICVCPPLTLQVKEFFVTAEWNIMVRLVRLPPCQATIHHADEEAAKKTAIAMAHGLCVQHKVDAPPCLDNPLWTLEDETC
ncbi:MAG: hypothetical protein JOY85_15025 [Acidobacteriaceae bacterium]|nr:hypothetical protein [Acidobacteriaceae bacterium]